MSYDDYDDYDSDYDERTEADDAYEEWEDSAAAQAYYDTHGEGYGWGSHQSRGWADADDDNHIPGDDDIPDFGDPFAVGGPTYGDFD